MKRYICDGIVKGATHVRNKMPCQDNKKIVEISDQIVIVAVADGHGSSKCLIIFCRNYRNRKKQSRYPNICK